MAEFSVACSAPVAGAQTKGVATLAGDVLAWRPSDGNLTGERTAPLHLITGHQRNKAGSKVPSLRLVVGEPMPGQKPNALVLSFPGAETDRDALSDAIKAALTEIMRSRRTRGDADGGENPDGGSDADRAHVTTAAERAAREALLAANRDLADMHGKLVMGSKHRHDGAELSATITDDEFWASRRHLLAGAVAKVGANQRTGIDNSEIAGIQGQRAGDGDKVTATLTHEKMHRIFAERPAVRQAFVDNVLAGKITERDFWTRFLKSEYFKMVRAGAPPQGEEEAADLQLFSRRPAPEVERRARVLALSKSVNLVADAGDYAGQVGTAVASQGAGRVMGTEDDVDGGPQGGHGIARTARRSRRHRRREPRWSPRRVAGPRQGCGGQIRRQGGAPIAEPSRGGGARGRPSMAVTDARSAAMAAEEQERAAWRGEQQRFKRGRRRRRRRRRARSARGPRGARGAAPNALTLEDRDAYFAAATGGTRDGEGDGRRRGRRSRTHPDDISGDGSREGSAPGEGDPAGVRAARHRAHRRRRSGGVSRGNGDHGRGQGEGERRVEGARARQNRGQQGRQRGARRGVGAGRQGRRSRRKNGDWKTEEATRDAAARRQRGRPRRAEGDGRGEQARDRQRGSGRRRRRRHRLGAAGDPESDACKLDDATEGALRDDAGMANELLRHFWSAQPLVTPARWDKADRGAKTLEKVYERLEATKRSQTGARRSAAAIRLKPLVQAMDAAFQFFDDEKVKRASAYEAFEKEKAARE